MKRILFALFVFFSFSLQALAAVNINTATQAELEGLHGIGPAKAKAIIDYRKKHGQFKSVDDLKEVNGIGTVTLAHVRKDVSVRGKTTAVMPNKNKPAKKTKSVESEKAAVSGNTADSKIIKETRVKEVTQADKTIKTDRPARADKPATEPSPDVMAKSTVTSAKKMKTDISLTDKK